MNTDSTSLLWLFSPANPNSPANTSGVAYHDENKPNRITPVVKHTASPYIPSEDMMPLERASAILGIWSTEAQFIGQRPKNKTHKKSGTELIQKFEDDVKKIRAYWNEAGVEVDENGKMPLFYENEIEKIRTALQRDERRRHPIKHLIQQIRAALGN